jgi:hypothetical protein
MSDLTSSLVGLIQRVFINLESTANAYYSLASPVVFAGDFEISVDIVTTSSSVQIIAGRSDSTNDYIAIIDANTIRYNIGGNSVNANVSVTDGLLHAIKVTSTSGVIKIYVDNVEVKSQSAAGTLQLDFIGRYQSGLYFDGIISNAKLTDIATPANSLEYALNQLTGTTETSNGNTLTYNNIATTQDVRDTFELSADGTEWVGALRTIEVA